LKKGGFDRDGQTPKLPSISNETSFKRKGQAFATRKRKTTFDENFGVG